MFDGTKFIWTLNFILAGAIAVMTAITLISVFLYRTSLNHRMATLRRLRRQLADSAGNKKEYENPQTESLSLNQFRATELIEIINRLRNQVDDKYDALIRKEMDLSNRWQEILSLAGKSRDKWRRSEALMTLSFADWKAARPILQQALGDHDDDIVYSALFALARIHHAESSQMLIEQIARKPESGQMIAIALEKSPPEVIATWVRFLNHVSPAARYWTLKLLTQTNHALSPEQIPLLARDSSDNVRAAFYEHLHKLQIAEGTPFLKEALRDSAWFVRLQALRALARVERERSLEPLIQFLGDDDSPVIQKNLQIVFSLYPKLLEPYFNAAVTHKRLRLQRTLIGAWVHAGEIKTFLENLFSPDINISSSARDLLEKLIQTGLHFGLKKELETFQTEKRATILETVKKINPKLAATLMSPGMTWPAQQA